MISPATGTAGQPLYDRLWGSGFLPSRYQGVKFRSVGDPVLYLSNPKGFSKEARRGFLDDLKELNEAKYETTGDPELGTRIAQYEMAYRMQASVPELTDLSKEPQSILDMYGPDVKRQGSFAYNCLMARRLVERGVRFVQIYHSNWDTHGDNDGRHRKLCGETDKPIAALLTDLKQRGMLKDTLVLWGGEFGRTPEGKGDGRNHNAKGFAMWMAGGGVKGGTNYGATDEHGRAAV